MVKLLLFISIIAITSLNAAHVDDLDGNFTMNIDSTSANINIDTSVNFDDFNETTEIRSDDAGIESYQNIDINNSTSKKQLMNIISSNIGGKGNSIVKKISEKDPDLANYNPSDIRELSIDNLRGKYTNTKRIETIDKSRDVVTRLMNGFSSNNVIQCYIKRSLVPSFYCPMNGRDNSYFTGGIANTTNEDAKTECDEYCKLKQDCLSKKLEDLESASVEVTVSEATPFSKTVPLYSGQILKSISMSVVADSNDTHVVMSLYGTRDGETVPLLSGYDMELTSSVKLFDFQVMLKDFTNITVSMEKPYKYSTTKRKVSLQESVSSLSNITLNYEDNKYWFCPATQFVSNAEECNGGKIEYLIIGDSPKILCIRSEDERRESTLGGYYSQGGCESSCYEVQECLPTYKNLGNSLTSSIYNVSYGCIAGDRNVACTKELCKEKIYGNIIPNKETVYYNDDQKEQTIRNGQPIEGTLRPTYNISAEMNTNDNEEDKEVLMVSMSKDMAYKSMMGSGTYAISEKTLNQVYDELSKATRVGQNGVSIEYVPKSNLFNNNKESYVYFIVENIYNFKELSVSSNILNSTQSLSFRSSNYTLVNPDGSLKLFYIEDKKMVKNASTGQFSSYASVEYIEKFVGSNGALVSYDTSSRAPSTLTETFTSDIYRHNYLLSSSYLSLANSNDGASLKKQVSENGHVTKFYNGSPANTGGHVFDYKLFLVTSENKLSYNEIISKIKNKSLKTVYSNSFSTKYTQDIKGHAGIGFQKENIRLFILGKSNNISVIGEFKPKFGEENKESFGFSFLYQEN